MFSHGSLRFHKDKHLQNAERKVMMHVSYKKYAKQFIVICITVRTVTMETNKLKIIASLVVYFQKKK